MDEGRKWDGRKDGRAKERKERADKGERVGAGMAGIADTFHGFKRESLKYERNILSPP